MTWRIVTATRGESPHWRQAAESVAAAAPRADHVAVGPPGRAAGRPGVPSWRWIDEEGPGLYRALNQGLRAAPFDWSAFTWINDDDELLAPGFGALAAELERREELDVVYGRVRLIDGRGAGVGALPVARRGGDLPALLGRGIVPLAQPGTVIRRRLFDRLGGFDESFRLAGDLDFFVRGAALGARFAFVNAWAASFRLSAGQLSKEQATREAETARALRPLWPARRRSSGALLRFRWSNLGVYADRVRRHGWIPMKRVYERVS